MEIRDRLREERERLGYSQAAFAAVAGASRNSQINWEKGNSYPHAGDLSEWADIGVDVLYVLTGRRSTPVSETLSEQELALLGAYRHVPSQQRKFIEDAVTMAAMSVPDTMTA